MVEELYVNKRGFKCVRSQLAKTDGRDPQEHGAVMLRHDIVPVEERDAAWVAARKAELNALRLRAPEFEDVDEVTLP